jgi:hypothetical protein
MAVSCAPCSKCELLRNHSMKLVAFDRVSASNLATGRGLSLFRPNFKASQ